MKLHGIDLEQPGGWRKALRRYPERFSSYPDAPEKEEETKVSSTEITSFTPSELMHGLTLKWIDDPDNYTPEQYLQAYDIAKLEHRDIHAAADPTAAKVERDRILRKLEVEKGSSS
jgi:hypothetical protein